MPIHTDTLKEMVDGCKRRLEWYKEMLKRYGEEHILTFKARQALSYSLYALGKKSPEEIDKEIETERREDKN
jgi:hypothetical protein